MHTLRHLIKDVSKCALGCGIPQEPVQEAVCHLVIFLVRKGPWTGGSGDLSSGLLLLAISVSLGEPLLQNLS